MINVTTQRTRRPAGRMFAVISVTTAEKRAGPSMVAALTRQSVWYFWIAAAPSAGIGEAFAKSPAMRNDTPIPLAVTIAATNTMGF